MIVIIVMIIIMLMITYNYYILIYYIITQFGFSPLYWACHLQSYIYVPKDCKQKYW